MDLFCMGSSWAKINSGRIFNEILVELWTASKQTSKKKRDVYSTSSKEVNPNSLCLLVALCCTHAR
jgi:hypothetical protein